MGRSGSIQLDLVPDGVVANLLAVLPFTFVWTCARRVSRRWAELGASEDLWRGAYASRWRAERSEIYTPPLAALVDDNSTHAWAHAYFSEFVETFGNLPVVLPMRSQCATALALRWSARTVRLCRKKAS